MRLAVGHAVDFGAAEQRLRIADDVAAVEDPQLQDGYTK